MALTNPQFQRNFGVARVDRYQAQPKNGAMGMSPERLAVFAELVTKERKKAESRAAFAKLVGITRSTLRALETASQQPSIETIEKLAKAIGTTSDALTGVVVIDPNPNPSPLLKDLSEEDLRVANRYHHLDADAKQAVKLFLGPGFPNDFRERIAIVLNQLLRFQDVLPMVEDFLASRAEDVREEETLRPRRVTPPGPSPKDEKEES